MADEKKGGMSVLYVVVAVGALVLLFAFCAGCFTAIAMPAFERYRAMSGG